MIPPNVEPPKTLSFTNPRLEKKIRDQLVYQIYVNKKEMEQKKFIPGNKVVLKFGDEIMGEGQIILVERVNLSKLTPYDALVCGFSNVSELGEEVRSKLLSSERDEKRAEFFKILYRWL